MVLHFVGHLKQCIASSMMLVVMTVVLFHRSCTCYCHQQQQQSHGQDPQVHDPSSEPQAGGPPALFELPSIPRLPSANSALTPVIAAMPPGDGV